MAVQLNNRTKRTSAVVSVCWQAYLFGSILLLAVLSVDPYFNSPSGLIQLELFTRRAVRHGFDPCSWDYEGSWKIGSFSGPSPTALNISERPLITCDGVTSTSASFVKTPFLHIPGDGEDLDPATWTVFYELRNLKTYKGDIGVSISKNGGASWQHLGVALADQQLSLSYPFIVYDAPTKLYVMFPDTRPRSGWSMYGRPAGGLLAFVTTAEQFPLGWKLVTSTPPRYHSHFQLQLDHNSAVDPAADGGDQTAAAAAASVRRLQMNPHGSLDATAAAPHWDFEQNEDDGGGSWGPSDRSTTTFHSTTAVLLDGRWWVFTSVIRPPVLPWQPSRSEPVIFTAERSLFSHWTPHPAAGWHASGVERGASAANATVAGAVEEGPLLPAGRPFTFEGAIHRWVHVCRSHCSDGLTLLRTAVFNATHYEEEEVASYLPAKDRSWHASRIGHADIRPVSAGQKDSWWGLLAGDRYVDGMHHFVVHELWFVELKATLRNLVAAQLALMLMVVALQATATIGGAAAGDREHGGSDGSVCSGKARYREEGGGSGGDANAGSAAAFRRSAAHVLSRCRGPVAALLGAAEVAGRVVLAGVVRAVAMLHGLEAAFRCFAAHPRVQLWAHAVGACVVGAGLATLAMLALPSAVTCPRWTVVVRPFTSPPHYVPSQPFVDPAGPFNVSNLTVISGCTMSFMDRLENLVGSLQHWEPNTPIVLYDLGFTSEQLATVRCWKGVQIVRFPYEDYPPHVREINNYAFKPLVFAHALERHPVVFWIDCGLEVRGPLDSMRSVLARDGYVSAQQSGSPADYSYTEKYAVPFFKLSQQEYDRVKGQPFCAGGLQGYVRGAASEKLLLDPAVACALDVNCISPPGHSRANYMYDQTAFTLFIRLNNYSSCMPRETHCTSAVKKLSWDPAASSAPIVIASRRHRWPKPYQHRVASLPDCSPDPATNLWRSVSSEHLETIAKSSSLLFKVGFVYGQAAGDFIIQASCCLGFHLLAQSILVAALLAGETLRRTAIPRGHSGGLGTPQLLLLHSATGGAHGGSSSWLWWCRPQPLLVGLLLMVLLMVLSMATSCRAI